MTKRSYDDIAVAILTITLCAAPIAMLVVVLFGAS
jgi:hypothetical protein